MKNLCFQFTVVLVFKKDILLFHNFKRFTKCASSPFELFALSCLTTPNGV
jgi:hypothetical protein